MGSAHSSHSSVSTAGGDDDEDDEEPSAAAVSSAGARAPAPAPAPVRVPPSSASASKVLEQEPEVLPCLAADSPLSPQPSAAGTPRLLAGPGIKVWDPCHVLLPPPPPSPSPHPGRQADAAAVEVVLVSHGECAAAMRPDLVGGRWPAAALTARGERQGRALAVFLRSRGARLAAAYASPLDRARATAALVCRVSSSSQLLLLGYVAASALLSWNAPELDLTAFMSYKLTTHLCQKMKTVLVISASALYFTS
jgi:phosphohistidine phosphatase SixA